MNNRLDASDAARALAARRRSVPGRCVVCGTPFTATPRRQYCSKSCRNHAEYERRLARRSESQKGD